MSSAELIYAAVIVLIGIPAALRNWTAAALVASYLFMQGSFYGFHITYPPPVCAMVDVTVIGAIYCKRPAHDLWPYADRRAQSAAFFLELSLWDRVVTALFPIGWAFYALAADAWWPLYWISVAQLLAAGFEALEKHHSARSAKAGSAKPEDTSGTKLATAGGGYG